MKVEHEPFSHAIVDGIIETDIAFSALSDLPSFDYVVNCGGQNFNGSKDEINKAQLSNPQKWTDHMRRLGMVLLSDTALEAIEQKFGIDDLIADPGWLGGGLHVMKNGSHLGVHIDFNRVGIYYRRINLLLYLNPTWKPEWGGQTELWSIDENGKLLECVKKVEPIFNRALIFETSERSFHGVTPITCPDDVERKSFACYYYTATPPEGGAAAEHSTVFQQRPNVCTEA
jgi:hypothetical protein